MEWNRKVQQDYLYPHKKPGKAKRWAGKHGEWERRRRSKYAQVLCSSAAVLCYRSQPFCILCLSLSRWCSRSKSNCYCLFTREANSAKSERVLQQRGSGFMACGASQQLSGLRAGSFRGRCVLSRSVPSFRSGATNPAGCAGLGLLPQHPPPREGTDPTSVRLSCCRWGACS